MSKYREEQIDLQELYNKIGIMFIEANADDDDIGVIAANILRELLCKNKAKMAEYTARGETLEVRLRVNKKLH